MKKGIFLLLIMAVFEKGLANQPLLVDVKIIGATQSPLFDPQHLQFDLNQDYMLVITNGGADAITFEFGTFGQQVFTRSIQGTASMTQSSLVINANSKVQWYFCPQVPGEYVYYAVNTALNSKGSPGKLLVKKFDEDLQPQTTQLQQTSKHLKNLRVRSFPTHFN